MIMEHKELTDDRSLKIILLMIGATLDEHKKIMMVK